MRRAVELGKQSKSEGGIKPAVGVVVARDGQVLGESFRGETGEGRHAEFGLIYRLTAEGVDLDGASVYSTLEPCSKRNHPKIPCAHHLVEAGVSEVYIGIYDPNPEINLEGWKILRDNHIKLKNFDADFRDEIAEDNADFINQYKITVGERGSVRYDFSQNGGKFTFKNEDMVFVIKASTAGDDSVHVLDYGNHIAYLKHATGFDEIDDPGAYDWSNYTRTVAVGQLGAARNAHGYLLFRVTNVHNQARGASHTELALDYEIRRKRVTAG